VKENTQKNIYFIVKVFKIMIRLIWLYWSQKRKRV